MREIEGRSQRLVFSDRVDTVAAAIRARIEDGGLQPGDKLPSEREIAELYKVSRNTVREALRELETVGLLHRRPGSGTYVPEEPQLAFGSSLVDASKSRDPLSDVMDLRLVIEPGIAKRAAIRARGQAGRLRTLLEKAREQVSDPAPSHEVLRDLDLEFHAELARLSCNPLLVELLDMSNDLMAPSRADVFLTEDRIRSSVSWHARILDAVLSGDGAGAFEAMEEHLIDIKAHTRQ